MAFSAGTRFGRFEIVAAIARPSSVGQIFRARDLSLDRDVVLSFLPEAHAADPLAVQTQAQDARILSGLSHPNIPTTFGLEQVSDRQAIASEFVNGQSLDEYVRRPTPVQEALGLGLQLAEALEAVHSHNLVHGALAPDSIIVTAAGRVKLVDLGTRRGRGVGGPADVVRAPYTSPEELQGRPPKHSDDIWAFGAILFAMLAGGPPFGGVTPMDTVRQVLTEEPDWKRLPRRVPDGIPRPPQAVPDESTGAPVASDERGTHSSREYDHS